MGVEKITVDLRTSLSARAFKKKESFYKKELEDALKKFEATLSTMEEHARVSQNGKGKSPWKKNALHIHEAIGIFGERGIGKTSFLLTLCQEIEEKKEKEVCILPVVDPTLIERAELFLVTVISRIYDLISDKIKNCDLEKRKRFNQAFSELAKSLRVLQRDSYLKELAGDPEIFAIEALKDAKSGAKLAEYFHVFCETALEILNKKFFVLPIDDIDMMLSRGKEILETIRKYFANDKIVIILSGHLPLYRILVKTAFFKQLLETREKMVDKIPDVLSKEKDEIYHLVEDLTNQYLLKLIPHYNRIFLFGINKKIWEKKIDIEIEFSF